MEAVAAVVVVVVVVVVAVVVWWPAYVSKAPVLAILTERVRSVARAIARASSTRKHSQILDRYNSNRSGRSTNAGSMSRMRFVAICGRRSRSNLDGEMAAML